MPGTPAPLCARRQTGGAHSGQVLHRLHLKHDRVVQEAVRWVVEPVYESTFHASSHGFRPRRSCHTAIAQAQEYLAEGREWVVDLDLENLFNRVNHQRPMSRLAVRVQDKSLLRLIGQMLKARIVMPAGMVVSNDEGVPQEGPFSPLLSNVVLDELNGELQARGTALCAMPMTPTFTSKASVPGSA